MNLGVMDFSAPVASRLENTLLNALQIRIRREREKERKKERKFCGILMPSIFKILHGNILSYDSLM
jgi:hypothetical protein